jgi:hypothetical protein
VVPIDIGGFWAFGRLGNTGTSDVLQDSTDEGALHGVPLVGPHAGNWVRGVFTRGMFGLYGVSEDAIFYPFTNGGLAGAPAPYGSVAGDNPAAAGLHIINMLNTGFAQAPAPPAAGAIWNRNEHALNATVAFCRWTANITAHELGHSLGLVATRRDIAGGPRMVDLSAVLRGLYVEHLESLFAASYLGRFNMPAPGAGGFRAGNFGVGSIVGRHPLTGDYQHPGTAFFYLYQQAHNGLPHTAGGVPLNPGQLPTLADDDAAPVRCVHMDDLGIPGTNRNFIMDSGEMMSFDELLEPGVSGVFAHPDLALPPFPALVNEVEAQFFDRNRDQIQAVLPRE